jgi:hypothetical protein
VVETDTISGTHWDKAYTYDTRLTATCVKRGGAWKAIALHLVKVSSAK